MSSSVAGKPISDEGATDNDLVNYKYARGQNWNSENVRTLMQWIHLSAIYVDIMNESTRYYRRWLRRNTILNLLFSTIASTVSISQFNISDTNDPRLSFALKVMFSFMTTSLAVATGLIKVYQIQEKLESSLQLQQDWTLFGSKLTSEMQLPENLRKDALYLIIKMKDTYSGLIKAQTYIPKTIIQGVAQRNGVKPQDLMLSELFERVIQGEVARITGKNAIRDDVVLDMGDGDGDGDGDCGADTPRTYVSTKGIMLEFPPMSPQPPQPPQPQPPQPPQPQPKRAAAAPSLSKYKAAYSSSRALNAISENEHKLFGLGRFMKDDSQKVSESRSRVSAFVLEPTALALENDERSTSAAAVAFRGRLAKKQAELRHIRRSSAANEGDGRRVSAFPAEPIVVFDPAAAAAASAAAAAAGRDKETPGCLKCTTEGDCTGCVKNTNEFFDAEEDYASTFTGDDEEED